MVFTEGRESRYCALVEAAREIREAVNELAGIEVEDSDDDPKPDFMSDEALRVATAIADHLDPKVYLRGGTLLEKLKTVIAVTGTPRRHL